MAIKPSPTIAGKLRKLFSNNKQTIEPAIGDSIPGGGSEPFVVTFSGTTDNASCDKTHPEIYEAWKSGRQIVVDYDRGDGALVTHNLPYKCAVNYEGSDGGFYFSAFLFDIIYTNTLTRFILSSGWNDRSFVYFVEITKEDYTLTPFEG